MTSIRPHIIFGQTNTNINSQMNLNSLIRINKYWTHGIQTKRLKLIIYEDDHFPNRYQYNLASTLNREHRFFPINGRKKKRRHRE